MLLHFIASRLVLISLSFLLALATTRYAKTAARFLKIRAQLKRTTHSWSHNLFSLVRTPLFKFRCAPSVLHLSVFLPDAIAALLDGDGAHVSQFICKRCRVPGLFLGLGFCSVQGRTTNCLWTLRRTLQGRIAAEERHGSNVGMTENHHN